VAAGATLNVPLGQNQQVEFRRVLLGVHLAHEDLPGDEALPVNPHVCAARLEARHEPIPDPWAVSVALADEHCLRQRRSFQFWRLGAALDGERPRWLKPPARILPEVRSLMVQRILGIGGPSLRPPRIRSP
jgi:hypothetical protein